MIASSRGFALTWRLFLSSLRVHQGLVRLTLDYIAFSIILGCSFGAATCCFAFTKYAARIVDEQVTTGEAKFTPIPLRRKEKGDTWSIGIPLSTKKFPFGKASILVFN